MPIRHAEDKPLLELLAARSPSECVPLLLELARLQAGRRRPIDLTEQFERDGFVAPSALDLRRSHQLDGIALQAASGFEAMLLSPLAPLGTCAAVSPSSQNRIVTTTRASEVVSDPTNVLALECARRLALDSKTSVRLCTVQQVVRAQRLTGQAGHSQHFRMFALATAGAAVPDHALEVDAIVEQIGVLLGIIAAWEQLGHRIARCTATLLTATRGKALSDRLRPRLLDLGLELEEAPLDSGYYDGVRVLLGTQTATGEAVNLADTGLFDWVGKLTSNRRMRFVASGFGLQLLPILFGSTTR